MWPLVLFVAILVMAVLVVPIVVTSVALFGAAAPWILFGLVMWAIIGGGGHRRRTRGWVAEYPYPAPRWPTASAPRSPARPSHAAPRPAPAAAELPIDVQIKVDQIKRKVELLLGYASRFPPFSQDLYLVRQTAAEYLPRTIEAYRALPPGAAEQVLPASGKTAHQELREQLEILDRKLDDIADDLQRRDLDRLLANRRFLEERFGHRAEGSEPSAADSSQPGDT